MDSKTWVFLNKCNYKKHYASKQAAKRAASATYRSTGVKVAPYHCPSCGAWHVSKKRFTNEGH